MDKQKILEHIVDITKLAIEISDLDSREDIEIILGLLECCKCANNIPNEKFGEKREWVKPWRLDRVERGTFSFVMNELNSGTSSFLNHLSMTPETFYFILGRIENDIKKEDTVMRQSITPAEKLAATLRYIATGESYKSISYQTRLSNSFLCAAIPKVCKAIWNHFKDEFLKFPTTNTEWKAIADNFAIKWQFPHCLGALDGKHIVFQSLRKDGSDFHNYKGTNSIVLLALVDADCRFIYVHVECNSGTHDAEVFLQSDLKKVIDNAEKYFPADEVIGNGRKLPYVIIGYDVFPLQKHIMKPYSHNTNKIKRKIFNLRLSRARHVVEHAFGILAKRFKIIRNEMNLSAENVKSVTKACCVLHNLLSHKNEDYLNMPSATETSPLPSISAKGNQLPNSATQSIREGFEEYFNKEGKLP